MAEALRSRVLALIGTSSDLINDISTKLESALSLSEASSSTEGGTDARRATSPSSDADSEHGAAPPAASRKLRALPTFGPTFEDQAALARHRRRRSGRRRRAEMILSPSTEGTSPVSGTGGVEEKMDRRIDEPISKMEKMSSVASSGSEADCGPSSVDTEALQHWYRSASDCSVQSWASSLSLDSQSDEAATVDFMRAFVRTLFEDSAAISQEQKAAFGSLCQQESGRLWFARLVSAQRARGRGVREQTFYALVQHFSTALFECAEADDFSPAKSLMNVCFTFYLEVEVPGCEPYKEYLYTYLRHQPIWHTLRFWNAAFFDALQCERAARAAPARAPSTRRPGAPAADARCQESLMFGQLGTFTYNMHAFGLSRELCLEFLRKQCTIAGLSPEQETKLKENIEKLYQETEQWRA